MTATRQRNSNNNSSTSQVLSMKPQPTRRARRRRPRTVVVKQQQTAPIPVLRPAAGPRVTDGVAVGHREYWSTISGKTPTPATPTTLRFNPGKSGMYMLDRMGTAFNDYVVTQVVVEVVGIGATSGTSVLKWCLDFKPDKTPPDAVTIMQHVPSFSQAGWQSMSTTQSRPRLMRRAMYATNVDTAGEDSDAFLLVALPSGTTDSPTWDIYCTWRAVFYHPGPGN